MMEEVSRTVLALANLATFSLLATMVSVVAVQTADSARGSALCRACLDYRLAVARASPPRSPTAVATIDRRV
jgi:hypothetical protein